MVDRIDKIKQDHYRVDETQDPLEEQRKNKEEHEQEEEEEGDSFDKMSSKTDWNILFDKSSLWERNVEVKVEDIDRIKFLGINLRTNPAVLKIRVFLYDGNVINTAFLSISRSLGLQIKNMNRTTHVDVNMLTKESSLWLTIPKDEEMVDDEITNITGTPKETSFSKTFKNLISQKTWMQRLGIIDPVSRRMNREIVGIYLTVVVVASAIIFSIVFMLF